MEIKDLLLMPVPREILFLGGWNEMIEDVTEALDEGLESEAYLLLIEEKFIHLKAGSERGLFYGYQTLTQLRKQFGNKLPCIRIEDEPYFKHRGMMLDVTRGRVPTMAYLKSVVDLLSHYKYNQLQLYMEHTFDFSFMKEVTHDKSPITADEFRELDQYCRDRHVALVPCIATFGHMFEVLSSDSFSHLCELPDADNAYSWMKRQMRHTIDCTNPESLDLVKRMIDEIVPLYGSAYLNICGDETYDIGEGRSKEAAQAVGKTRLYVDFLNAIMAYVREKGKTPMYWGDVILAHPDYLNEIEEPSVPMHWWYEADVREEDFKLMSASGKSFYACPSVAGWNRFVNNYEVAYSNITKMVSYAKGYGAQGILNTDWGDFGHVNHLSTSLPYMVFGAHMAWHPDCVLDMGPLHARVSALLFDNEEVTDILARVNSHQRITWEVLMKWWYEKTQGLTRYGSMKDYFSGLDQRQLKAHDEALETLYTEVNMLKLSFTFETDRQEWLSSIEAIRWSLALASVIASDESDAIEPMVNRQVLAVRLEQWLREYRTIWLKRNRESELRRIEEVIKGLSAYLATAEKNFS